MIICVIVSLLVSFLFFVSPSPLILSFFLFSAFVGDRTEWLSDLSITNSCTLLVSLSNMIHEVIRPPRRLIPRIFFFDSLYLVKLLERDTLSQTGADPDELFVRLVTRAIVTAGFNPSAVDVIIFTRNISKTHWGVVLFWVNQRACWFYDGNRLPAVLSIMQSCLRFLSMAARHYDVDDHTFDDPTMWTCHSFEGPEQRNGFDCGVFVIAFVHAVVTGRDPNASFGQRNMARIRVKLAWLFTDPMQHMRRFQIDELRAIAQRLHAENGILHIEIPNNPFNPVIAVD